MRKPALHTRHLVIPGQKARLRNGSTIQANAGSSPWEIRKNESFGMTTSSRTRTCWTEPALPERNGMFAGQPPLVPNQPSPLFS
jgi:hypothetical protein